MADMGRYCKAYMLNDLSRYPGWMPKIENMRPADEPVDGAEADTPRSLTDDCFLYIQENYTVTDGIFMDEYVVFDDVTEAWQRFCRDELGFEIPAYMLEEIDLEYAKLLGAADDAQPVEEAAAAEAAPLPEAIPMAEAIGVPMTNGKH